MISIALTGGVATGKSSVVTLLERKWGEDAAFYSADEAVHELLTREEIKSTLTQFFGSGVVSADGEIDRGQLREIVFQDEPSRKKLEGILHPKVRTMGEEVEKAARRDGKKRFVSEIPLLYEIESDVERNYDLVVASSEEIQRKRLVEDRGLETGIIDNLIKAQMPLNLKMARADFVIWNDADRSELEEQVNLFCRWLDDQAPGDVTFSPSSS